MQANIINGLQMDTVQLLKIHTTLKAQKFNLHNKKHSRDAQVAQRQKTLGFSPSLVVHSYRQNRPCPMGGKLTEGSCP